MKTGGRLVRDVLVRKFGYPSPILNTDGMNRPEEPRWSEQLYDRLWRGDE